MLSDAWGNVIDLVEYDDESPWPNADGNGSYLQLISTSLDNSLASSWMASSASLGAQDFAIASLVLYPNPVRNIFTVNSSARIDGIQVFDSLGRIVKSTTAHSETVEVDANDLVQGVYLVKITSGNVSKTVSIVKQ